MTWEGLTPPYRTIVADPPWRYTRSGVQGAVDAQYSTLSQSDIAALPVSDLAADDAHLYLWVTTPKLWDSPHPAEIAAAWGFAYKTLITWVKGERVGIGWYYRVDTEHCLFCTRGKAPIPPELRESNVLWAPRSSHSAKPPTFLDMVERVSDGPMVELFARRQRFGWDSWGFGYEQEAS
jgi:N6-adenosine-specific RNA methylase IME4